jgi:hypothetical protein
MNMKKSEQKQQLVEELARHFKDLNVKKLYREPNHKTSKDWLAEVAAILKNLDETDFRAFANLRQHLNQSIQLGTRKHTAEQIDGFVRQKVAEYKRYDFSYLDRELKDSPGDFTDYIHDKELRDRCLDLLDAGAKFDRVINQATQVLEDKLRTKANIISKLKGVDLVNKVLNPELNKTVLVVSEDASEQRGFCDICRGVMLAFRNPTHHYLTDKITREEAFKLCAFIDTLLPIIESSKTTSLHPSPRGKAVNRSRQPSTPRIKVKISDNTQVSWANYALSHKTYDCFRIYLEIDNFNSKKSDYLKVKLTANTPEGKWVGDHFVFNGEYKMQDSQFRIEAEEVKEVEVFISDHVAGDSLHRMPMPQVLENSMQLVVETRSGEAIDIPIPKELIITG